MRVLFKESPRTVAIYSDTHTLCFRELDSTKAKRTSPVAVEILPNNQVTKEAGYRTLVNREVHGCLGLITVEKQVFLAVISGAITNVASPLGHESVDKIYSVDFLSLSNDEWDFVNLDANGVVIPSGESTSEDYDEGVRTIHPCSELKKLLSNGSFYYSNDFDLTSLLQNRGVTTSGGKANGTKRVNLDHYRLEYMWNSFLMEELFKLRSNMDSYAQEVLSENRFLTTVIRGFAKTTGITSAGDCITIVSKQSWKRAGTRFNARGIDDNGNVANFVETEFIYNNPSHGLVFSFTQIRGSVPTFWEQDSTLINPKITLTRSLEATQPIYDKHFSDICLRYGVCHIVNLLSKTKPAEVAVLRRFKELYNNTSHHEDTFFSEFDFHHETKQAGGFAGAAKILPLLHDSLEQFGWFVYDIEQAEVVTRQDGVFRVNCLDCLDRTNLIEQVICRNVFQHVLQNQSASYGNNIRDRHTIDDLLLKHNTLWADNGDAISQIYTGTNALKSSFSRSGKMNFAGALSDVTKSVSRMYQNTFVDSKKQSVMDLLLGYDAQNSKPVRIYDPINDYVQGKLKERSSTFTTYENINVFVGTFNVNAASPNIRAELTTWLFPPENTASADIYAIGLQELIELNAGSILTADTTKGIQWSKLLENQLNSQGEQFLLLRTESIASMSLLLFVKKSQVHKVTQVSGSSKKTGLGGIAANKGACAVRFEFGLTAFALITSHLAAGTNATVERYNDYQTIIQGLTFTRNHTIKDHDHIIWFGDLNYRINLPNDHCRYLIEGGAFDELYKKDQLSDEMSNERGAFHGWSEADIKFFPTYKFDKGTSNYDTSEKQRVPSWTDRILHMTVPGLPPLKQLNYNSVMDCYISDHKPVYATFDGSVRFVDASKKQQMAKELYTAYKAEHGDLGEVSLVELSDSASSESKASMSTVNTNFTVDTLSEMNLIDDFDHSAPKLPSRPSAPSMSGPRRIPPPPTSRKSVTTDLTSGQKPNLPRRLPPKPEEFADSIPLKAMDSGLQAPAPPPARRTTGSVASAPTQTPIGFSSTPLIPSRPTSGTSSRASPVLSPNVTTSTPNLGAQSLKDTKRPMIPAKPTSLVGSKTRPESQSVEPEPRSANTLKPAPPPPRPSSVEPRTMSDWKPLVPK